MVEWLSMGGRGAFVWSAYGITALVLIVNWMGLRHQLNAAKLKAKQLAKSDNNAGEN